jgi:hypothetical protein
MLQHHLTCLALFTAQIGAHWQKHSAAAAAIDSGIRVLAPRRKPLLVSVSVLITMEGLGAYTMR